MLSVQQNPAALSLHLQGFGHSESGQFQTVFEAHSIGTKRLRRSVGLFR